MEKLYLMDRISKLRFHWTEKNGRNVTGRNVWKIDQKAFPLARKSLSTNRNAFQNRFPLDGKIKLAVADVSQNGRKKNGFH